MPAPEPAVKPLMEGPLHEAFLSPRKDHEPVHVAKAPPAADHRAPGVDPPSLQAEWIEGYWEWDPGRKDYVWVTGTWRVPPPGRFWVNGYWKRDDQGWYRVPGFWSDAKTDRLDYRKDGPPAGASRRGAGRAARGRLLLHPRPVLPGRRRRGLEEGVLGQGAAGLVVGPLAVGPAARRLGLPGWLLGPHPRGSRHPVAPAEVNKAAPPSDNLTYQPYTTVSPELYGQLNGAFGRPNSNYDGYPGVFYDEDGRYYGYANYGNLVRITAISIIRPAADTDIRTMPLPCNTVGATAVMAAMGRLRRLWWLWRRLRRLWWLWRRLRRYGGYGGLLGGGFGLGFGLPFYGGFNYGMSPFYGGLGFGGLGFGGLGFGGFGFGGFGLGLGFGFPDYGFGYGFGSPFFGLGIPFYGGFYYPYLNAGIIGRGFGARTHSATGM